VEPAISLSGAVLGDTELRVTAPATHGRTRLKIGRRLSVTADPVGTVELPPAHAHH